MRKSGWLTAGLGAALVFAVGAPVKADDKKSTETTPGGVKEFVYKQTPQGDLKMFVHYPPDWKSSDKRPVIVFFFGGGWRNGSPTQFLVQAEYLASRGMVAARADYRVSSRHNTTPDKCVEDAKSAVRWLRVKAAELGVDPERVVGSGGSAGGHIAACAALSEGFEAEGEDTRVSSKPNVLVLYNPALDLVALKIFVKTPDGKDVTEEISPLRQVKKGMPPTVMFFGTADKMLEHGKDFTAKAKQMEVRCQLFTAEGMPHSFFNRSPWKEATLLQSDKFLVSLGYLKGEPTLKLPEGKGTLAEVP